MFNVKTEIECSLSTYCTVNHIKSDSLTSISLLSYINILNYKANASIQNFLFDKPNFYSRYLEQLMGVYSFKCTLLTFINLFFILVMDNLENWKRTKMQRFCE